MLDKIKLIVNSFRAGFSDAVFGINPAELAHQQDLSFLDELVCENNESCNFCSNYGICNNMDFVDAVSITSFGVEKVTDNMNENNKQIIDNLIEILDKNPDFKIVDFDMNLTNKEYTEELFLTLDYNDLSSFCKQTIKTTRTIHE